MNSYHAFLGAVAIGLASLPAAAAEQQAAPAETLVYFGTHGNAIVAARLNEQTGRLTAIGQAISLERPTWLVTSPHAPVIYAVEETGNDGKSQASVVSLAIDTKTGLLSQLSKVPSGGAGATHLAVDGVSHSLFVANYGTGQVAAIPIEKGGLLDPPSSVQADYGTGPSPRQQGPHAHAVAVDPTDHFVLAADLGADRIFIYRLDASTHQLSPSDPPFASAPAGSGPRHMVFHPNGKFLFLDSELTGEITSYAWNSSNGTLRALGKVSTTAPSYAGTKSAAELVLSRDGRFLYVSNRGEDTIVAYTVNADTGELSELQRISSGGEVPWSFSIAPSERWLLAANEASSLVTVLGLDPKTGRLKATDEKLAIEKPVSVAFYPLAH